MDIRFTISAMGEANLSVTGIKEITHLEAPSAVVNAEPIPATLEMTTKRKYNRKKKISRKNRRK